MGNNEYLDAERGGFTFWKSNEALHFRQNL